MKPLGAAVAAALLLLGGTRVALAQRGGTNPAEDDTNRCRSLLDDNELPKAELACAQALQKDGSYIPAWKLYLAILVKERKEDKVIAEAERAEGALGIGDPSVLAWHGAAIYSLAGRPPTDPRTGQPNKWARQYAKSLPYLERAAAADPSLLQAQAPLCTYWTQDQAYMERSKKACQAALKIAPDNQDVLASLGYIYNNENDYVSAQRTCDAILRPKHSPEMEFKAKVCLGIANVKKGDCPSARRVLEPLQRFATKGGVVVDLWLGRCAVTQPEAEKLLREYMRIKPMDVRGPLFMAEWYIEQASRRRPPDNAMFGLAQNELYKAKQLDPKNRQVTRDRATVASALGRYSEAEAEWKAVFDETGPQNVEAVLGYGIAARKAGDTKVAVRVLDTGSKKNPDHADIKFELGRAMIDNGELSAGVREMETAFGEDSRNQTKRAELVVVLVREGVKFARAGKAAQAEPLLEKAVKYEPGSVIANRDLGLVRLQQRRFAEAVPPLEVWRGKTGKDRDSNLILGRALAGMGKREEAVKAYEQAREAAQRSLQALPMAEVLLELGPLYVQVGRYGDAVAALETARDNVQAAMNMISNAANAGAIAAARALEPVVRRNRALAYLARGYDSVQKRQADSGVADLQKVLEDQKALEPRERANATCALAMGFLGAGKAGQAVVQFQAAQKVGGCDFKSPYDRLGLDYWIAYARYREGTPQGLNDAIKIFAKAQTKASGEMVERFKELIFTAYMKLMAEEYVRGNNAAALAALKNAQKVSGQVKDEARKRDLAHNLAVLDLAQGKTAQAKQQFEQLGARPPEAMVNLGLIYERQGDIQKALQLWQQSGRGGKVREWIDATRRFLGAGAASAGGQP